MAGAGDSRRGANIEGADKDSGCGGSVSRARFLMVGTVGATTPDKLIIVDNWFEELPYSLSGRAAASFAVVGTPSSVRARANTGSFP